MYLALKLQYNFRKGSLLNGAFPHDSIQLKAPMCYQNTIGMTENNRQQTAEIKSLQFTYP